MKRDMDLVRQILLSVEETDGVSDWGTLQFPDVEPRLVRYHTTLLVDAGFLDGQNDRWADDDGDDHWLNVQLTWQGHEFLDGARNDARWEKAKTIMQGAGGFALDVMKTLLVELAKKEITLPGGLY